MLHPCHLALFDQLRLQIMVFDMLSHLEIGFSDFGTKGSQVKMQKIEFVSDGMSYISTRLLVAQCFLKKIGAWHKIFAQQSNTQQIRIFVL
jgi:hypothetical protein